MVFTLAPNRLAISLMPAIMVLATAVAMSFSK
jgi:hypothetical protein